MINSTSYNVSIKDLAVGNYEFVISDNKYNVSKSFSILKEKFYLKSDIFKYY